MLIGVKRIGPKMVAAEVNERMIPVEPVPECAVGTLTIRPGIDRTRHLDLWPGNRHRIGHGVMDQAIVGPGIGVRKPTTVFLDIAFVADFIPCWNQPFGVGPGAFSSLYQFFRPSSLDPWPAQMHNDWLESLITLGGIGLLLSLFPLFLIFSRCFLPGGIPVRWPVIALFWVSLSGCLVHALVDFPFQIESILILFTLLCSQLSAFSKTN